MKKRSQLMAILNRPDPEVGGEAGGGDDPTARMSFFDHLEELRKRIIYSLVAISVGVVVGFSWADQAYNILSRPIYDALRDAGLPEKLNYISPLGPARLLITVGLYLGVVIAAPVVFHQIWLFVAPGLYKNERKAVTGFLISSVFLFLAGTAFAYYVLLPITLKFLLGFAAFDPRISPMITMDEYLDFVLVILLGIGVIFQLPILIFILSIFGLVTPAFLWNNFRYAVLIIAIVAAVVTPTTDVITMGVFMAPMLLLYIVGIGVSAVVVRDKRKAAGEPVASGAKVTGWIVLIILILGLSWAMYHFGWWKLLRR
ncbi:MAG: twin-arginine translocase subunit TatC [Acidobacteria bacterium]|nr:twin-arginine translocase subunit TatC [Acidobacteriota bacterium]